MSDGMMGGMAGFGVLIWILGVVIAVLWIALPFAVFGIKKRLDAILVELKRMDKAGR
ncbi:hypothetical protein CDEF62S_00378 [Castellaniella defragrans]